MKKQRNKKKPQKFAEKMQHKKSNNYLQIQFYTHG